MPLDDDKQHSADDDGADDLSSIQNGGLSWLRAPMTIPQLCALGIIVVGVGIRDAIPLGGWAWLGLGSMVIVIFAMTMVYEGWRMHRRYRLLESALRRTRTHRRSTGAKGTAQRRTGTRRGGKSNVERSEEKAKPSFPRLGKAGEPEPKTLDGRAVNGEVLQKQMEAPVEP
jgi:hypothetical protein